MNRSTIGTISLLTAFLLLLGMRGADVRASDDGTDEQAYSLEQDQGSRIRVLLTRLQAARLTVTLDGSYTLEPFGLAFQRGAKLLFVCEEASLSLYYEGMAVSAERFALRRHELRPDMPVLENGLRMNDQIHLYAGELALTADEGLVRPVLALPMEEYLLGVVPYEMSESFPLEALKAQAVAARTYAQRKTIDARDYDVTDNTNDQVYRGYNAAYGRAVQAVRETAGLCGFVGNELARCYYSASNGGQTELMQNVWPDGGKELFTVQDDPYDLLNPKGQVREALLPRIWPKPGVDAALDALAERIKPELAETLIAMGYDNDAEHIRLTGIENAELQTPRYPAPSRLMTEIRLWVRLDARKEVVTITPKPAQSSQAEASGSDEGEQSADVQDLIVIPAPRWTAMGPVPQAIAVDLPLFPEVKRMLGLSINSTDNELFTLEERERGFMLEARRFGHGVGMSQRGAEWMAGVEGWTFEEILRFYYPGISLNAVEQSHQPTLLPPVDAAFLVTPGPPATATPRPTLTPLTQDPQEGEWIGEVTAIADDSWLNLRAEPHTGGKVLKTLYLGQPLLVAEELTDGWLRVRIDTLEGYVMAQFVKRAGE